MIPYLVSLMTFVSFFMLLALALNLQWGMTGMVNFGIAGFYALGAYASGLLTEKIGLPVLPSMALAVVAGLVAGGLLSLISFRLREDYFAIVTLGFGELIRLIVLNEDQVTEGPRGLRISDRPLDGMIPAEAYPVFYLALVAVAVFSIFLLVERIRTSPMGRTLRAIRDDDVVAGVMGKDVLRHRIEVFAIGGGIMGLAGALYAHYIQNISPDVFTPMVAIFIWMSVIVGGAGNNRGLLLGAGLVMFFLEGSRFLGDFIGFLDAEKMSALRIILIGVFLIITLHVRPRGLIPEPRYRHKSPSADFSPG